MALAVSSAESGCAAMSESPADEALQELAAAEEWTRSFQARRARTAAEDENIPFCLLADRG